MYDFDEQCCGGKVLARRRWPLGVELRIEPNIATAWRATLSREATEVADALDGLMSGTVRVGLDNLTVRRNASAAEIGITGVMLRMTVAIRMDLAQASRLASVLRPPAPAQAKRSSGANRRRDEIMRQIFG